MMLVRHAESEFNAVFGTTRRDPGIEDPRLTETGRRQAAEAAHRLAHLELRRIITSPYTRAIETAMAIAGALELPVEVEPLVRERRAFVCDIGSRRSRLREMWPDLAFSHLDENWWAPGEESEASLLGRCAAFRTHMAGRDDWPQVAVVSHWGFIRCLTGHALTNGTMISFDPT